MENASKALLIAGAVLIVILLIGIGILIYSRSTGVVDTATGVANTQEIQAFNSQFTGYEGKQKGSSVKSLLSTVLANNATYGTGNDRTINHRVAAYPVYEKMVDIYIENITLLFGYKDHAEYLSGRDYSSDYITELSATIITNNTYHVTFENYENGFLQRIKITDEDLPPEE